MVLKGVLVDLRRVLMETLGGLSGGFQEVSGVFRDVLGGLQRLSASTRWSQECFRGVYDRRSKDKRLKDTKSKKESQKRKGRMDRRSN